MTHLTQAQILQMADGTADYATQATVTNHLAVCSRCRSELELQRSLLRAARRMPLPSVSDRFTRAVMARILPKEQNPAAAWILNNMGNMFAMMAVLGVLAYVLTSPAPVVGTGQASPGNAIVQELGKGAMDAYAKLNALLKQATPVKEPATASNGSDGMISKLALIVLSLAVLAAADRFWLSRLRERPRV